jgi:hypothetical protein
LTRLSVVDKLAARGKEDATLSRLLELDDEIMEMGKGYWVEIHAARVSPTPDRPHGVDYSLCLLDPDDNRLVCYDNSHAVSVGRAPSRKKSKTRDHKHEREIVKPYDYVSAEKLLEDFWSDVERVLKKEGVS